MSELDAFGGQQARDRQRLSRLLEKAQSQPVYTCSPTQRRLWFLAQLHPRSAAYNMPVSLQLDGEVEPEAIREALTALVEEHEVLRTTLVSRAGQPVLRIHPAKPAVVQVVDLSAAVEPERAVRRLLRDEAGRPFDLAAGPLLRCTLLRQAPDRWRLLLVLHHAIADGVSIGILIRRLAELVRRRPERSTGSDGVRFVDWAAWREDIRQSPQAEADRAWWQAALGGLEPMVLPGGVGRRRRASGHGETLPVSLGAERLAGLREIAAASGVTLFMLLEAQLAVLLHRHTGAADVVLAVPVGLRDRPELDQLVGCLVDLVPVRIDLRGDPPFGTLLERARDATVEALRHTHLPFEDVVRSVRPQRCAGEIPLAQVGLTFQPEPVTVEHLGAAWLRRAGLHNGAAKFPLHLELVDAGEVVFGDWEYDCGWFQRSEVEALHGQWLRLLDAVIRSPRTRISRLPLLTEAERGLAFFTATAEVDQRIETDGATVHALVYESAGRFAQRPAVVDACGQWTYRELRQHAGAVAGQLVERGVGRGDVVAVAMRRERPLVAALLGVMEAGAAYLPLDPTHPQERLAAMLDESGARVVLEDESSQNRFSNVPILRLSLAAAPARQPPPPHEVGPDDLAYILFTSGTTGRPRGVAVAHGQVVNLLKWAVRTFSGEALSGCLCGTSTSFDLSVFELFASLCAGGTALLAESVLALERLPYRDRITLINTVPSAFAELLEADLLPRSLRTVNLAGEPLREALAERIHRARDDLTLNDLYGPTECTTYSTWTRRAAGGPEQVGSPIDNTRVYLLDRWLEPVPPGGVGEVFIAGAGVARGYVGRPGATAEVFLPDLYGPEPGGRMYRTGDLGRCLPTGQLTLCGRRDRQLKVRGLRIEPAEVEAALLSSSGVRFAVVQKVRGPSAVHQLAAWVEASSSTSVEALEAACRAKLPAAVVPDRIVIQKTLPRLPGGKIDQGALVLPEGDPTRISEGRTPTEQVVLSLWREITGNAALGRRDDFFRAGGDSLLAVRAVARLRQTFDVPLATASLFEAPDPASVAAHIDALAGRCADAFPALPPDAGRTSPLPVTYTQERMWFLSQLEGMESVYHIAGALLFDGGLSAADLEACLSEVFARHEALRTRFELRDGEVLQRVGPCLPTRLEYEDLSDLEPANQDSAWRARAARFAKRRFDLAAGPLHRALLLRLAEHRLVLLTVFHHIIVDATSLDVLLRELLDALRGRLSGERRPRPRPPSLRPAQRAVWERARLEDPAFAPRKARLERWWLEQLTDVQRLDLAPHRPLHPTRACSGAMHRFTLPAALVAELEALAAQSGTTLFTALLAGWMLLLHRRTGRETFAVGVPIADPMVSEAELAVGMSVRTVALRADLSGRPSFRQVLERARRQIVGARVHIDLPFSEVVRLVRPQRGGQVDPIFQTMVALRDGIEPASTQQLPGLKVTALEVDSPTARYDLTLFLQRCAKELRAAIEYRRERFEPSAVEAMAGHFARLLAGAVAEPDRAGVRLPLLSAAERGQLLESWNPPWTEALPASSLPELVDRSMGPGHKVAVEDEQGAWTYRELRAYSELVAAKVRRAGVRRGDVVGLCMARSRRLVGAMLGVMRAGAAWLPLDPDWPARRLEAIVRDSGARVALCDAALRGRVPAGMAARTLPEEPSAPARAPACADLSPDDLAYAIPTSGSTGRPKCVGIEHRGAVALMHWAQRVCSSEELAGVLASTSIAFDLAVFELFAPLCAGGSVVLARDVFALETHPAQARVRLINTVPSAISELIELGRLPPGVRTVCLAGEPLSAQLVGRVLERSSAGRVLDLYGPTEATTYATWTARSPARPPDIGRPIDGTRAYVLDAQMQPVPVGVPGEIYLGGLGLSRGYLGRVGETAERFVPDPHGPLGSRLYRTGDAACLLSDGRIRFLGRLDRQIKLRGHRIELAEIESVLVEDPQIREAMVTLAKTAAGDPQLCAWCVGSASRQAIGTRLARRLPGYMLPARIELLAALPRLPNGKVDLRALAERPAALPLRRSLGTRPEGLEALVASAWAEVLGRPPASADEDFFAAGGTSLSAARLVGRVRSALQLPVSLRMFYAQPTPSGMLSALHEARLGQGDAVPLPIAAGQAEWPAPLTAAQRQIWLLQRLHPESPVYNIPVAFRLRGALDREALRAAFDALLRRHPELGTRFFVEGARPLQEPVGETRVELDELDLRALGPDERSQRARSAGDALIRRPFDLETPPLLRALLVRETEQQALLAMSLHHIVADAWALNVLVPDLFEAYGRSVSKDTAESGPPAAVSIATYARWERSWLHGPLVERALLFWRRALHGWDPSAQLAGQGTPDVGITATPGILLHRRVPRAVIESLRRIAQSRGATLFHGLIAAFLHLWWRRTGRRDQVIGVPVSARGDPELDDVIGFLTNTVPLRVYFESEPSYAALVTRVRDALVDAIAHAWMPLERIAESLPRSGAASLFETVFVMQHSPVEAIDPPGLELEQVHLHTGTAKFPFMLVAVETVAGLDLWLETSARRFGREESVEILDAYVSLLGALEQPASQQGSFGHPPGEAATSLAARLREHPAVADVAVVSRRRPSGEVGTVAYVVLALGTSDPRQLEEILDSAGGVEGVPVSTLPLAHRGELDTAALARLPVIGRQQLEAWQVALQQHAPDGRWALVLQEHAGDGKEAPPVESFPERTAQQRPQRPAYAAGPPLRPPAGAVRTLPEALISTAARTDAGCIHLISMPPGVTRRGYDDLLAAARRIAGGLRASQLDEKKPVLLQLPVLWKHLSAFWGCILAGCPPVTVEPPPVYEAEQAVVGKLVAMLHHLDGPPIIASRTNAEDLRGLLRQMGLDARVLRWEELVEQPAEVNLPSPDPTDVAFFQLSSGSTGSPKCIPETHDSVLQHVWGSAQILGYHREDVTLNWLPMDHVVPTLTFHVKDCVLGSTQVHLPSAVVLGDALRWLDLLEAYRATLSWAPNFGFCAVARAVRNCPDRRWDLSSLRYLVNAGEQVTPDVVRGFVEVLQPFGLRASAVVPAFGMAEAATCMTYRTDFDPAEHIHYVERRSLGDSLRFASGPGPGITGFVDLGPPMPGVEIRIAEGRRQLPEGVVGHLQIRGPVVMPGYHRASEANRESFVGDGWFDSGDLGFMLNGRLALTGRAKEIIVINGVNYSCVEIEALVATLPEVRPNGVAAVSMRDDEDGTEALALFVVPAEGVSVEDLIRSVGGSVSRRLGIAPRVLVALAPDELLRTTSGKIQRTRLKQALAAGHFDGRAHRIGVRFGGHATVPYRRLWVRARPRPTAPDTATVLLLGVSSTLAMTLQELLTRAGRPYIWVDCGASHAQRLRPGLEEVAGWSRLLDRATSGADPVTQAVCLWTADAPWLQRESDGRPVDSVAGALELCALARALARRSARELIVVGRAGQAPPASAEVNPAQAALVGLARSLGQELPRLHIRHVDLEHGESSTDAEGLLAEMAQPPVEPEVAWRGLVRWVPRIGQALLPDGAGTAHAESPRVVVLGGLGGIGRLLIGRLAAGHTAQVLALGRQPAASREVRDALSRWPASVCYLTADAERPETVREAVRSAEQRWGKPMSLALNLAGVYEEVAVSELGASAVERALRAKARGTAVLGDLVRQRRGARLVVFSSVSSWFGGALAAPYTMACRFAQAQVHNLRAQGVDARSIAWSAWSGVGMGTHASSSVLRSAGYASLSPEEGTDAFERALDALCGDVGFGLDPTHRRIRRVIVPEDPALLVPTLFVPADRAALWPSSIVLQDAFGSEVALRPTAVFPWPERAGGRVDLEALARGPKASLPTGRRAAGEYEEQIARIWRDVLRLDDVGAESNFFDLGGTSISLARVHLLLQAELAREVEMVDLFRYPTIASLARHLQSSEPSTDASAREAPTGRRRAGERLRRQRQARQRRGRET